MSKGNKFFEILKDSGIFLLLLLAVVCLFTSGLFFFHIEVSRFHLAICILLNIIIFFFLYRKKTDNKIKIISIVLSLIILLLAIFMSKNYLDLSWDGNSYHKDAVGLLKNGWNPVYENYIDTYEKVENRNMDYIGDTVQTTHGFWQTNYPKATWLIGSTIYAVTDDIESAKAYNILILYITFALLAYLFFQWSKKSFLSMVIAGLSALNPILLVQLFTFYIDGFMGNLLILLIFFMFLFVTENTIFKKKELYFIIGALLMLIINTKFTGFGYAGIFCLAYYLFYIFKKIKSKKTKELICPTILFAVITVIAVAVIGFSPYIKNLVDHKQIFYPLQGENKVDIVTYNQPAEFQNKSTLYKSFVSLFSKTSNANASNGITIERKIPFTVDKSELSYLSLCDARIGGFGVWFSGILLISILICFFYLIRIYCKDKQKFLVLILPLVVSIGLILLIGESWWARYIPFIYIFPIYALLFLLIEKRKWKYPMLFAIIVMMLINIGFFIRYNTIVNNKTSLTIMRNIDTLQNQNVIIVDTNNEFLGMMYNFEDHDINFSVSTQSLPGDEPLYKWIKYRYKETK